MPKIHVLDHPRDSSMLDYTVNIYKDGQFVKAYRYEGYSGNAMMDEVKDLNKKYPESEGYQLKY